MEHVNKKQEEINSVARLVGQIFMDLDKPDWRAAHVAETFDLFNFSLTVDIDERIIQPLVIFSTYRKDQEAHYKYMTALVERCKTINDFLYIINAMIKISKNKKRLYEDFIKIGMIKSLTYDDIKRESIQIVKTFCISEFCNRDKVEITRNKRIFYYKNLFYFGPEELVRYVKLFNKSNLKVCHIHFIIFDDNLRSGIFKNLTKEETELFLTSLRSKKHAKSVEQQLIHIYHTL